MDAREGIIPKDEGITEEESEHRRSRLWLGYSEDNLRNTLNSQGRQPEAQELPTSISNRNVPHNNDNHDEAAAPSPIQDPRKERERGYPKPRNSHTVSPEGGNVTDSYENLDEVAAPSPIQDPPKDREQGYLEDRNIHTASSEGSGLPKDFDNLDELAAPSPIEDPQKERGQGYLEDRFGQAKTTSPRSRVNGFRNSDKVVGSIAVEDDLEGRHNGHLEGQKSGSPSPEEDRMRKDISATHDKTSKLATEVYTISHLIFFSILGTLARLGLQTLTFYPGAPVQTGVLWSNVGGSLIIGFLSEDRKLFRDELKTPPSRKSRDEENGRLHQRSQSAGARHAAVKKTIPLYIGLATGFCGSFTSFSSFMRDAFFALSNALPVPIQHPSSAPISQAVNVHRNPGYSFLAILAVLIVTVGLSLMALKFGAHLALFVEPYAPSVAFLFSRRIFDRSVVLLAFGCWLAAIFMAIWPPDRPSGPAGNVSWMQETWRSQALFALVFAPLGCLLRFYASLHLNGRIKAFPLGTFTVNMFGTAMLAMFLDLQRVPIGGMVGCQVLQGMADGFCGCLTTVSTWVVELTALRLRHAYFYGLTSVGVALSLLIIITGSLQWTRGFVHPLCTA